MSHVLLIDDDSVFTDIIGNCLTHGGISCVYVPSGVLALERLATQELPGAILLDVRMPDMDGFSVLENLKKNPRTSPVPVVMFSNDGVPENKQRALLLGAVDYLTKVDASPQEVLELVRGLLPA
jgi:CheY-like chemotaxis protein